MHSTTLLTRITSLAGSAGLLLVTTVSAPALTGVLKGVPQEETSQENTRSNEEPSDEDEWYDPTDWFDGNDREQDDTSDVEAQEDRNDDSYRKDDQDVGYLQWFYVPYTYDWYDRYVYDFDYHPIYLDGWWFDTSTNDRSTTGNQASEWRWDAEAGEWKRARTQRSTGASSEGSQTANRSEGSLSGTVESFNRVRIGEEQGQRRHHTLVKVRLQDGTRRLVDLGPDVSIDTLDVAEGDQVKIEGRRGTIAKRDVLRAGSMRVEGERVDLASNANENRRDRTRQKSGTNQSQEERNMRRSNTAQNVSLRGELDSFREVPSEDGRYSQLLVRLHLDDGTKRVVDFGRAKDLEDLDLSKGSQIVVHGHRVTENGRTILRATQFLVDGERQMMNQSTSRDAQEVSSGAQSTNRSQTNRTESGSSQSDRSSARRTASWTSGFVDSIREISLPGARGNSTFARIRLDDDTTKILDLGPSLEFEKLDCEPGDYMTVRGTERTMNGRDVLVVRELRVNADHRDIEQEDWQTPSTSGEASSASSSSGAGAGN